MNKIDKIFKDMIHVYENHPELILDSVKAEIKKEIAQTIDKLRGKTYHTCDCGDYNEGCLDCLRKDMKKEIIGEDQ